jgi:sugar fermentation stimulation protein A
MKFQTILIPGKFLKRYKRFFVDVELDLNPPEIVVAHCANTGTMTSCLGSNWPVLMSKNDDPKRKLKYSLEMIHNGKTWIGLNTGRTNGLAVSAILNGVINELKDFKEIKQEVSIGESRIDIMTTDNDNNPTYIEVKNVTLVDNNIAYFPDAITERGQKHLLELIKLKAKGIRAVMLFIVQREDCEYFSLTSTIDQTYSKLLKEALSKGVEVLIYQCELNPNEIKVVKKIPHIN